MGIETVGIIRPFPLPKDLEIKKSELHLKITFTGKQLGFQQGNVLHYNVLDALFVTVICNTNKCPLLTKKEFRQQSLHFLLKFI